MPFTATPDTMAGAGYTLAAATCDELPACALTPREEREYERLPHAARQRDWLAGRYAAKRAISARWSVPAAQIELSSSPGAAPRPFVRTRSRMGGWSALSDRLTIAHHDGVAIAVAVTLLVSVLTAFLTGTVTRGKGDARIKEAVDN